MESIIASTGLVFLLNNYPIKLSPSSELDFAGAMINIYQIGIHILVGLKFLGIQSTDFLASQTYMETTENQTIFLLVNLLDYIGFIAIFSRLDKVHWLPKTIANTHIATQMMSLWMGHSKFQEIYIFNNYFIWNLFRGIFVWLDAIIRGYYHFFVLNNIIKRK
jgi:hypothetical protein